MLAEMLYTNWKRQRYDNSIELSKRKTYAVIPTKQGIWTISSVGQSIRLITERSLVRDQDGPLGIVGCGQTEERPKATLQICLPTISEHLLWILSSVGQREYDQFILKVLGHQFESGSILCSKIVLGFFGIRTLAIRIRNKPVFISTKTKQVCK